MYPKKKKKELSVLKMYKINLDNDISCNKIHLYHIYSELLKFSFAI